KTAKRDALTLALGAVIACLHSEERFLVEARHRAVAGLVHRVGDAAAVLQRRLHRLDPVRILIVARRDAEGFFETPLQVKRTCADGGSELLQSHTFAAAGVEVAPCFFNDFAHAAIVRPLPAGGYPDLAP